MIDPSKESRLSNGVLAGLGGMAFGIIAFGLSVFIGGASMLALAIVVFVLGLVVLAVTVFAGLGSVKKDRSSVQTVVHNDTRVVARFAINHIGEMIFDIDPQDIPDLKFYVRLQFRDGRQGEFSTRWEVFGAAGEGMWGAAAIQGDWLGGFTPTPKPVGA